MSSKITTAQGVQPRGKALLDDPWLDAAERMLQDMARTCEQQIGHKPSLEDLRQLLLVTLRVDLEDYFAEGSQIEVADIVFKTRQKPASQRYAEGDVFVIPLGGGKHAFGRLLRFDKRMGALVEVFRETSARKTYRRSIAESGRLFHPVIVNDLRCLKNRRWTVVHRDPTYRLSPTDAVLEFAYPKHPKRGWLAGNPFDGKQPHRPITEEEARRMTTNALLGPEDVEVQIRGALKMKGRRPHARA